MRIEAIVCSPVTEEKLSAKHDVSFREVWQVLVSEPRVRFAESGHTPGDDVYAAFGQTLGGRYLSVFFVYKQNTRTAMILSARDMTKKERKAYGRK